MYSFTNIDRKKPKSLRIRLTTIMNILLSFLLILPDDVFRMIPLYKSETPSSIVYSWLEYNFNIIQLVILVMGAIYIILLNKKSSVVLIILMFCREIIYLILGENSIFVSHAYEIYLTIFVGYAFVLCVEGGLKTYEKYESFLKWFLVTNMLTIYINLAMNGINKEGVLTGRYHSSNLDVGGTGTLCVLCILYLIYDKQRKWNDYIFILLSSLGLLLTGSRSNLVFLLVIVFTGFVIRTSLKKRKKQYKIQISKFIWRLIILLIVFVTLAICLVIYHDIVISIISNGRFAFLTSLKVTRSDGSFLGRIRSLTVGLDILKKYPVGISGYFINLQQEMQTRGYPTFPHSTLVSMYLLLGPIVFIIYGMWIRMLRDLKAVDSRYFLMILYYLISTTIYGGPITNFKEIFMMFMITYLAKGEVSRNKEPHCFNLT